MNEFERAIEKVDTYLRLTRYQYSSEEKLSRLSIINDYYTSLEIEASEEKLSSGIETAEQLGAIDLPLKVRGVFLTEGRPKRKYYTQEHLSKSVENPINQKFPLMLDHEDTKAGKIIGMVDKIEYDDRIKGIRWYGHINDETFARNVLDKIITQVSATIFSDEDIDKTYGIIGKNLTYKELSLVMRGQEPRNSIEVDI